MQNGTETTQPVQNGADSIHFITKSKMGEPTIDPTMKADVDSSKLGPALFIWQNNKGIMEHVPENEYGRFYRGDCYVIYQCKQKKDSPSRTYHIHFWIGDQSNELDERMDVALHATLLDEYLGGKAVQFRELLDQESDEFKAIFGKKGVPNLRYLKGGNQTRLRKISVSTILPHLYEVKGRRHAQAREIDCKLASLNSDDSYVLDGRKCQYVLWGKKCNKHEKTKAYKLACSIRDNEYGGRGYVEIIEEENFNKSEHAKDIRKLLNVVPSCQLKFENLKGIQGTSDEEVERKQAISAKLYKISDAGGTVEIKELGPPKQSDLDTNDCFILYTGLNVYVWKGRYANPNEKKAAIITAKEFLKNIKAQKNLGIVVMPEFAETAAFRSCFPSWKDDSEGELKTDYTKPYRGYQSNTAKSVHLVTDFRRLHEKPKKVTVDDPYAFDNGQSKELTIYRIDLEEEQKRVKYDTTEGFVFNSGESYIIVYEYGPKPKECIIYYWLGNDSSQLEKGTAAKVAVDIDDGEYGGEAVQERVIEGKEPPHFMRIFDGFVMVKQDRFERNLERLFHVKAKNEHNARVIEVAVDASNLNSNDCFILDCNKGIFLWYGKGSTGDEQRVARKAAMDMYPKRAANYTIIQENGENSDFWNGIGGKKDYATQLNPHEQEQCTYHEPRLYHCWNLRGSLEVEEVCDFDQDDLNSEDVFFLDTYYRQYIWIGKESTRDERAGVFEAVEAFIAQDPTGRTASDTHITAIAQGHELEIFKSYFGVWEEHRVEALSLEDQKELAKHYNTMALAHEDVPGTLYSLDELQDVPAENLPFDVDVEQREMFLRDEAFESVFNMTKEEYKKLPKWQRNNLRKQHKLF